MGEIRVGGQGGDHSALPGACDSCLFELKPFFMQRVPCRTLLEPSVETLFKIFKDILQKVEVFSCVSGIQGCCHRVEGVSTNGD